MVCQWRRRRRSEPGQGLVEYSLILVVIAVALIVIVTVISHQTNNLYVDIDNGLTQAVGN